MYYNTGQKISLLANIIFKIQIIIWIIIGIALGIVFEDLWILGLIIGAVGIFFSWLLFLFLAAFGELVENTFVIRTELESNVHFANTSQQNRVAGSNEWKCSKCGAINQSYVGTCGCGQTKAEN